MDLAQFNYYDLEKVANDIKRQINNNGFDTFTKNKIRQTHNNMLILVSELHLLELLLDNRISQKEFFNKLQEDYNNINFLNLEL